MACNIGAVFTKLERATSIKVYLILLIILSTGTIAFVLEVTNVSIDFSSKPGWSLQESIKSILAPLKTNTFALETSVKEGIMTSSLGEI